MLKRSKKFNKNAISLLVCLVIAVGLWCYVAFVENPDMTRWIKGVPITISGSDALQEKGLSIQSVSNDRMDLKIRAARNQFRYLSPDTITATADVSRISRTGSITLNVTVSLPPSTPNASVVDRHHSSVTITVEEFVEKEFDLEVDISKQPSDGYYIHSSSYDTDSKVTVSGTASAAARIAHVKTVPIDLSGANSNAVYPASLTAYDVNGKEVAGVSFNPEKVNVTFELYHKKTVPVSVAFKRADAALSASVTPAEVTVDGPAASVDAIEALQTEPIDTLSRLAGDKITAQLVLPPSVFMADGAVPTCEITFTANE